MIGFVEEDHMNKIKNKLKDMFTTSYIAIVVQQAFIFL